MKNVDPALTFELLFVGEGYVARSVSSVDSAGAVVDVVLDRLEIENIPAHRMVTGRIVDRFGDPIEHAVVAVSGRTQGRSSSWGRLRGFMKTPVAVTDDTGRFLLVANEDFDSLHLDASARNYANQEFYDVVAGEPDQEFVLPRGARVTGRLLHDGQPLANRKIEIASENRRTRSNFTQTSVPTDEDGVFTFYNLPPKLVYNVTASMESIQDLGKTPLTRVGPLQDEEEHVIEDLVIEPGILLEGQVVTDDESPIPTDSVLLYTHDKVWGVQSVLLPPDGRFSIETIFMPEKYASTFESQVTG